MNDPDLGVEPFDEAERRLIIRPAVGGQSFSIALDQAGEILEGIEPLPLQGVPPVIEEFRIHASLLYVQSRSKDSLR
ncbi:MAG: hypothetical protein WCL50_17465 [Spirochaetota bacterium]